MHRDENYAAPDSDTSDSDLLVIESVYCPTLVLCVVTTIRRLFSFMSLADKYMTGQETNTVSLYLEINAALDDHYEMCF